MTRKKKPAPPFAVNPCSICEHIKLTFGQQEFGGIRYCVDCFRFTLAWVQLGEEGQERIIAMFRALDKAPDVQRQYALLDALPKDQRQQAEKNTSIGESRRRLFESGEHDGTEFLPPEVLR